MDDLTPYLEVIDAAREEMMADLDPKERELVEAAQAAYSAEMDRFRADQERMAERVAEREQLLGPAWEQMMRETRELIERNADIDGKMRVMSDWARSRVGDWTHVVELPAERIEVAGYQPEPNPSPCPDTP